MGLSGHFISKLKKTFWIEWRSGISDATMYARYAGYVRYATLENINFFHTHNNWPEECNIKLGQLYHKSTVSGWKRDLRKLISHLKCN
jgi:hypothetical protein